MDFTNFLMTKKEFEEKQLDLFNKWWFSEGKNIVKKDLFDSVYISDNPHDLSVISTNNWHYLCEHCVSTSFTTHIKKSSFEKMIRSKLWNMGINVMIDSNCKTYIKLRDKEKYSDCFIFFNENIIRTMESLIYLSDFSGLSINEVENLFNGKNVNSENVDEQNNGKKNKNKRNKKNKNKKNKNNTQQLNRITTIKPINKPVTFDIKDYITSTTSTSVYDGNDIVTLHNDYGCEESNK